MAAGIYNFNIEQGTTFKTSITLQDSDGNTRDLTEYYARGHIRESADSTNTVAIFTCTIPNPKDGTIFISLKPSDTSGIDLHGKNYSSVVKYVYDIEIYKTINETDEEVYRVLNGFVFISPEVTK